MLVSFHSGVAFRGPALKSSQSETLGCRVRKTNLPFPRTQNLTPAKADRSTGTPSGRILNTQRESSAPLSSPEILAKRPLPPRPGATSSKTELGASSQEYDQALPGNLPKGPSSKLPNETGAESGFTGSNWKSSKSSKKRRAPAANSFTSGGAESHRDTIGCRFGSPRKSSGL